MAPAAFPGGSRLPPLLRNTMLRFSRVLTPGKDANVVFVRGREYRDRSRQDQLIERYRHLPRTNN